MFNTPSAKSSAFTTPSASPFVLNPQVTTFTPSNSVPLVKPNISAPISVNTAPVSSFTIPTTPSVPAIQESNAPKPKPWESFVFPDYSSFIAPIIKEILREIVLPLQQSALLEHQRMKQLEFERIRKLDLEVKRRNAIQTILEEYSHSLLYSLCDQIYLEFAAETLSVQRSRRVVSDIYFAATESIIREVVRDIICSLSKEILADMLRSATVKKRLFKLWWRRFTLGKMKREEKRLSSKRLMEDLGGMSFALPANGNHNSDLATMKADIFGKMKVASKEKSSQMAYTEENKPWDLSAEIEAYLSSPLFKLVIGFPQETLPVQEFMHRWFCKKVNVSFQHRFSQRSGEIYYVWFLTLYTAIFRKLANSLLLFSLLA